MEIILINVSTCWDRCLETHKGIDGDAIQSKSYFVIGVGVVDDIDLEEMDSLRFPLDGEMCNASFEHWLKYICSGAIPSKHCIAAANSLLSTHTFSSVKVWKGQPDNNNITPLGNEIEVYKFSYPYKEIFFKDFALLSDGVRESLKKSHKDEPKRKMSRARSIGLNWFVFCSLGIHDPYYAGDLKRDIKPFGAFIGTSIEIFPDCHGSRRDIDEENPEVIAKDSDELFRYFMSPQQARELLPKEIANDPRFNNDFFEYWGNDKQWGNSELLKSHWQWKYELHFFKQVPLANIEVILWPSYCEVNTVLRAKEMWGIDDLVRFRDANPQIKIIDYPWDPDFNGGCFWNASYEVAKFFCKNKRFPDSWIEI